jgi:hypothetical protein
MGTIASDEWSEPVLGIGVRGVSMRRPHRQIAFGQNRIRQEHFDTVEPCRGQDALRRTLAKPRESQPISASN